MGEGNVLGRIKRGKENTSFVLAFNIDRRESKKTLLHAGDEDKPKFLTIVTKMGRGGGDLGLLGACGKEVTNLSLRGWRKCEKEKHHPIFRKDNDSFTP
jgi:hypothetical protein